MTPINFHKKEKPLTSLASMGGGAAGMSHAGAAGAKVYADDIFSTYLWRGDASSKTITNGIDLAGEGGMVWVKNRETAGQNHRVGDTVRGGGKMLFTSENFGSSTGSVNEIASFGSTGFTVGSDSAVNQDGKDIASWSFRKQKGFFDIQTWTGNDVSGRTINHDLGCVPGFIVIKRTDGAEDWTTHHAGLEVTQHGPDFNGSGMAGTYNLYYDEWPTDTSFKINNHDRVNKSGWTYVAYIFAGGRSTTNTAVEFDGNDWLSMPISNSDFNYAGGDSLTIECFIKLDSFSPGGQGYNSIVNRWGGSGNYCFGLDVNSSGNLYFYKAGSGGNGTSNSAIPSNVWSHIAVVKDGTTGRFFINGKADGTFSWPDGSTNNSQPLHVGNLGDGNNYPIDGQLANVRITMKQALYVKNFNPPHEITRTSQGAVPSNVKLLCCNKSTTTGSTVAPSTITATGDPTITSNNRLFDDTEGHIFGEEGDQSMIRCGTYVGDASSPGPELHFGWEPQWVIVKRYDTSGTNWVMWDTLRGFPCEHIQDAYMYVNNQDAESNHQWGGVTSKGMMLEGTDGTANATNGKYMYIAIRRPDPLVSKAPEAGTEVFAMDYGNASTNIPAYDSGFRVDYGLEKRPQSTISWWSSSRVTGGSYIFPDDPKAQSISSDYAWDSNVGYVNASWADSTTLAYMWQRYSGLDVVNYRGDGNMGHAIPHNLTQIPEMMWMKRRDGVGNWHVYHQGLNGGVNPQEYTLILNSDGDQSDYPTFADMAPTATHFYVGDNGEINGNASDFAAMLFSSVTGISKCGFYAGNGAARSISTGFTPRFLMIKAVNAVNHWFVLDSVRGWTVGSTGTDNYLRLNSSNGQAQWDFGAPTATGFDLIDGNAAHNASGTNYIYYAHA